MEPRRAEVSNERIGHTRMLGKMHDSLPGHGSPGSYKEEIGNPKYGCLKRLRDAASKRWMLKSGDCHVAALLAMTNRGIGHAKYGCLKQMLSIDIFNYDV